MLFRLLWPNASNGQTIVLLPEKMNHFNKVYEEHMKSKVRDLFRRETKEIKVFDNFNQIYYVVEQMVLYDVDVPELEGLSERLPYALNKIASEKLDRNDIITFFPIIWNKFESYVRKLLFIIRPDEYQMIRKAKNSSVKDVLEVMGIKVNVAEPYRTKETEAIHTVYTLRNSEAHVCETWSIRKTYDKLAKTLAAYLIVTNKVLSEIQSVMKGVPDNKKIYIPSSNGFQRVKFDVFDDRYDLNISYNIFDYIYKCHKIGEFEFDENGWIISSHFLNTKDDYESVTKYIYEKENNRIIKRRDVSTIIRSRWDKVPKEEERSYRLYSYDDENNIIKVEHYRYKIRAQSFVKILAMEIEYLSDGGVSIIRKQFSDSYNGSSGKYDSVTRVIDIRHYNSKGYLTNKSNPSMGSKYIYSENGLLKRIEYSDYSFDVIHYIGDNIFRIHKNREEEEGYILEKRFAPEGKLKSIQRFKNEDDDGNKTEVPELIGEIDIEYYDEQK